MIAETGNGRPKACLSKVARDASESAISMKPQALSDVDCPNG
jgi:hypothetical protein